MAEKAPTPYIPELPPDPYAQRELIYVNSKVGLASFEFFVRKNELKDLGYPENFFDVGEFGGITRTEKHIERVRALHEIVGPLGFQIDDGIQTLLKVDSIKDKKLTPDERKEVANFIDAVILTTNYYERLVSNGGNAQIFVATTETSRNGVVSSDDNARLNMRHLRSIVKHIPQVSDVIAILDREYSRQFDMTQPDTWKSRKPQEIIDEITKPNGMSDERFSSVKILARAWYDLLGMPDIRSYQHKNNIVLEHMPVPVTDRNKIPNFDRYRSSYISEPKTFETVSQYRGIPLEYNSVFAFVMDPLKLQSGVLKNFKGLGIELSAIARYADQSDHNIFNLGWFPAGFRVFEEISKTKMSIEDLNMINFSTYQLKNLSEDDWGRVEENIDWQKIMINQLEKADGAKVAFLKLFSFDPKAIGDLYSSVGSYLRDSSKGQNDKNLFNRNQVLPMLTSAVIRIFSALKARQFMPVDKRQMLEIVNKVEEQMWPDKPFTDVQKKILIDDLSIDSAATAIIGAYKSR